MGQKKIISMRLSLSLRAEEEQRSKEQELRSKEPELRSEEQVPRSEEQA